MPSLDQIRTILIQYRSDGAERVTSELNKLADAQQKVGETSDTSAKRQLSAAGIQQSLLNKYDLEYRAQTQIAQALQKIQIVRGAGLIGQQEEARLVDLATKYHMANSLSMREAAVAAGFFDNASARVREGLHALHPVLDAAGVQFGGMRAYAAAAGLGMTALAGIVGAVLTVVLIKATDTLRIFNAEMAAITGSKAGGQNAFAGLKSSAESGGVALDTIAGAYQTLLIAQQKLNSQRGIVFAPGAETALKQINDITTAIALSGKIGLLSAEQIKQAENAVAQSIVASGKLTADAFSKLPVQIQRDIAIAFGGAGQDIGVFQTKVEGLNLTFDKLAGGLGRIRPLLEEQARNTIPTLGQAWDDLKTEMEITLGAISKGLNIQQGVADFTTGIRAFTNDFRGSMALLIEIEADAMLVKFPNIIKSGTDTALSYIVSWASSAASAIGSVLTAMRTAPVAAAPQFSGAMGAFDAARGDIGNSYDRFSGQLNSALDNSPQFASGTGGIRTVPSGFGGDSYHVRLTSGEQYAVAPPGYNLVDMLAAKSSIDLGGFENGTMQPSPDAATTDQGHSLLDLGVSYQDLLGKLGVTLDDWRQTVTGAGNNKIEDVIRESAIRIITSESMSCSKIVAAINLEAGGVITAINTLSSVQQAATQAQAATANAANAALSTSTGSTGGSSGGGGAGRSSGLEGFHISSSPSSATVAENDRLYAAQQAAAAADLSRRYALSSSNVASSSTGFDSSPRASFVAAPGIDYKPLTASDQMPFDTSGYSGGWDYAGAEGGNFIVPPGFSGDKFRIRASSGEHVAITTPAQMSRGASGGGVVNNFNIAPTVVMSANGTSGQSKEQIASDLAKMVADSIAANSSANRSIGPYARQPV